MNENVVKVVRAIFELASAFASSLVKVIKKDKSWVLAYGNGSEMDKLLAPLLRHVRADCIGRKRQERALKTIN